MLLRTISRNSIFFIYFLQPLKVFYFGCKNLAQDFFCLCKFIERCFIVITCPVIVSLVNGNTEFLTLIFKFSICFESIMLFF